MTLEEALLYSLSCENLGHKSDGCTFAPDLAITKYCKMHDYLIRFNKVKRSEADKLLFAGIWTKGGKYKLIAILYYIAVRWTSFCGGQPLPAMVLGLLLFSLSIVLFIL